MEFWIPPDSPFSEVACRMMTDFLTEFGKTAEDPANHMPTEKTCYFWPARSLAVKKTLH
jgi:hypothetical protein